MDDIEHELFEGGRKLEQVAQSLRIREAEITIRDGQLAEDLSELIATSEQSSRRPEDACISVAFHLLTASASVADQCKSRSSKDRPSGDASSTDEAPVTSDRIPRNWSPIGLSFSGDFITDIGETRHAAPCKTSRRNCAQTTKTSTDRGVRTDSRGCSPSSEVGRRLHQRTCPQNATRTPTAHWRSSQSTCKTAV